MNTLQDSQHNQPIAPADYPLALSALQHFAYCPRQFGLIHLEQAWADNLLTAQGNILHERVDSGVAEQRGHVRSERSVSVQHEALGIHGKLDLLEVETAPDGSKRYFPVEYKRGKPKLENWDKIQLCAQALCLESMRGVTINAGALWYWQERKREHVDISAALRAQTLITIEQARAVLYSQRTPAPTPHIARCKACSLLEQCQPAMIRADKSASYYASVFDVVPIVETPTEPPTQTQAKTKIL